MRKFVWSLLFLLTIPAILNAQATTTSKLAWDQPEQSLAAAQADTYKMYPDGSTTATVLSGVTCTGTASPFQCVVAFPAFTPGSHTLQLSGTNVAGEGPKSSPFAFVFVVVPGAPINIKIQ